MFWQVVEALREIPRGHVRGGHWATVDSCDVDGAAVPVVRDGTVGVFAPADAAGVASPETGYPQRVILAQELEHGEDACVDAAGGYVVASGLVDVESRVRENHRDERR